LGDALAFGIHEAEGELSLGVILLGQWMETNVVTAIDMGNKRRSTNIRE
jgi:hypothetical protein